NANVIRISISANTVFRSTRTHPAIYPAQPVDATPPPPSGQGRGGHACVCGSFGSVRLEWLLSALLLYRRFWPISDVPRRVAAQRIQLNRGAGRRLREKRRRAGRAGAR